VLRVHESARPQRPFSHVVTHCLTLSTVLHAALCVPYTLESAKVTLALCCALNHRSTEAEDVWGGLSQSLLI